MYQKPDIVLQSSLKDKERGVWEVQMRVLFRRIGSYTVTLQIPEGDKILDMASAADEAQRIVVKDLLATAVLNSDWLDGHLKEILYGAFPSIRS